MPPEKRFAEEVDIKVTEAERLEISGLVSGIDRLLMHPP
jgi:hypothetical protein